MNPRAVRIKANFTCYDKSNTILIKMFYVIKINCLFRSVFTSNTSRLWAINKLDEYYVCYKHCFSLMTLTHQPLLSFTHNLICVGRWNYKWGLFHSSIWLSSSNYLFFISQLLWRKWEVLFRPWDMLAPAGSYHLHLAAPPEQQNLLLSSWPPVTQLPLRVQEKWRRAFSARCASRTFSRSSNSKDTTRRSTRETIVKFEDSLKVGQAA